MNGEFYIVAVKDELTETFLQPIFAESKEEAIRLFKYQINNIGIWKYNASDYSFYLLGMFNTITGEILPQMAKLVSGSSVLDREERREDDIQHLENSGSKEN